MENNKDLAQKSLESNSKNFFFNHVKELIAAKRSTNTFEKELENIYLKVKSNKSLYNSEFELLGVFCFLVGIDYTGMAYPQKKIIENVSKRFEEVEITKDNVDTFKKILNEINGKDLHNFIDKAINNQKEWITKEIPVSNEQIVNLKLLKSKLNKFLDNSIIPIGYSNGIVEIKRNNLTWENVLKINSLLNEQAIYTGQSIKKFIEVYSDPFFNKILKKASEIFDNTKFSVIYEESIISTIESLNRFKPVFNPDEYSDEEYDAFENEFITKQEEKLKCQEITDEYKPLKYTGEQVKQLMTEAPDEFVILNLQESGKFNSFISTEDIIKSIKETAKNTDFVQHIYQYLRSELNNPNRVKGATALDIVNINDVVNDIEKEIKTLGETYKNLAEINCAEIPENQLDRIVNMVNDTIKACYLQTKEQKQYLISQIIENGITTWNHLQQILSIIETCTINGSEADTYTNLVNYITEKSNIAEVFNNSQKLNDIQIELQLFTAYRDWFKFHQDTEDKDIKTSEK